MEHRLWKVHLTGPDAEETQQTIYEHLDDYDMGSKHVPLELGEYTEDTIGITAPRQSWRVEEDRKHLLRTLNKMLRKHGDPGRVRDAQCMTGVRYLEEEVSHVITPLSKRIVRKIGTYPEGFGSERRIGGSRRSAIRRRLYTGD